MANYCGMRVNRFDIRKIRKLADRERYAELYFHWREAEHMIASNLPPVRRYGRRLKKRVERLEVRVRRILAAARNVEDETETRQPDGPTWNIAWASYAHAPWCQTRAPKVWRVSFAVP